MGKLRARPLALKTNPAPRRKRRRSSAATGYRFKEADAYTHSRKVKTPAQARQWASVANSALASGYGEGRAIKQASGVVKARPTMKRNTRRKVVRRRNPRKRSPIDRLNACTIQATGAGGQTFYYTGDRFDTNARKAAKFFSPQAAMRTAREIDGHVPKELRSSLRVVRP